MDGLKKNASVLEVRDLKKHYQTDTGLLAQLLGDPAFVRAVDGVSLRIDSGETVGIVGESGSGKSTLAQTILRIETPTDGEIHLNGTDVCGLSRRELRPFRKQMQMIFQDPYESMNPKKRIFQIIAEPLQNFFDLSQSAIEERIEDIMYEMGLRPPSEYMYAYPDHLSGGQLQRVNIARAVVVEPDLLVADEPLSMLDVSTQANILKLLEKIQQQREFAMMYITHDMAVAQLVSDRIGVMYRGKIVELGDAENLITDPKHPYTQALISAIPEGVGQRERVHLPPDQTDETDHPRGCDFAPRCPERIDGVCSKYIPELKYGDTDRKVACFLYHEEGQFSEQSIQENN